MWTDWEEKIDANATIPKHLLWDVDLKNFDWQKGRAFVVLRVIEYGLPEDYYTLFRMYGGVKGVRKIIKKNILHFRYPRDLAFVCIAFDLKEEEMECYKRKLLREAYLNS
jgi:hypothetical protein